MSPPRKRHPGVVEVMTPENRPALAEDPDAKTNPFMFRMELLQNDFVRYANQAIAVVIAETLEAATEGATLLAPRYEAEPARARLDAADSYVPPAVGIGHPAVVAHGDVEAALASAAHTIEATYETPAQYHNAMEPHAIVASWDGDTLSIDTPTQGLAMAQAASPACSASRRTTSISAARSLAAVSAARDCLRTADPRHPRGQAGRPARQARAAPRPDVWPGGHRSPSRQRLRMGAAPTASSPRSIIMRRSRPRPSTISSSPQRMLRTRSMPAQ